MTRVLECVAATFSVDIGLIDPTDDYPAIEGHVQDDWIAERFETEFGLAPGEFRQLSPSSHVDSIIRFLADRLPPSLETSDEPTVGTTS